MILYKPVYSQCNCFEGYEIGDPNDPTSVTNLSQTDLYADFPLGLTGNGNDLGCVNIYGRLVINEDYFFDNCNLILGEGAEIEIRSDNLTIRNQTYLAGCLTMWRGIRLTGSTPTLEMENSIIRDAQYAVHLDAPSTNYLHLTNNVFDANYVGLLVTPNTTSSFQQNEKDMNGIYLAKVAQGKISFTTSQQTLVDGIADICPSTGGTGVFSARSLKQYYAQGWSWTPDECTPVESHSGKDTEDGQILTFGDVRIFPNPAQSSFNVQFPQPLETETALSIYDVNGKLRAHSKMAKGTSDTIIDVANLAAGIYIVEIKVDGEVPTASRITIVD